MVRTKEKISKLRSELDSVKGRMATYCEVRGINDSQKTLIKECFKASKIVNPKKS
jgi:hypothetical protein